MDSKGPNVKLPPPLIFLFFMILAWGVNTQWPLTINDHIIVKIIGIALTTTGLLLILIAVWQFKQVSTHIEPWKPTYHLVTSGIFGFSRNPIYLGLGFITIGGGIFVDMLWVCLSVAPSLLSVYWYVIKREEAYLEAKFGEEYLQYKRSVGRWL